MCFERKNVVEYSVDDPLSDDYVVSGALGRNRQPDVPVDTEYDETLARWNEIRSKRTYLTIQMTRLLNALIQQRRASPP